MLRPSLMISIASVLSRTVCVAVALVVPWRVTRPSDGSSWSREPASSRQRTSRSSVSAVTSKPTVRVIAFNMGHGWLSVRRVISMHSPAGSATARSIVTAHPCADVTELPHPGALGDGLGVGDVDGEGDGDGVGVADGLGEGLGDALGDGDATGPAPTNSCTLAEADVPFGPRAVSVYVMVRTGVRSIEPLAFTVPTP